MIYKRGNTYWYEFVFNKERFRASTRQGNPRIARQMESAHRTSLAKGEVGLREKKVASTLREFIDGDFRRFIESTFAEKLKTKMYYEHGIKVILAFDPLANERLDRLTAEGITAFVTHRQSKGLKVTSVNRELEVLRRTLKLAMEWGKVEKILPKVRILPGEQRRDRVVTHEEEKKFLLASGPLLRDVATVLVDCGLRPEECFRLKKSDIRDGAAHVQHGKTEAARRRIPMTPRVATILEKRCAEGESEWVFPAPTQSGHIEPSSVKRQQLTAFDRSNIKSFPLYTLRHTCLTRWAPHMDPYTLAYLAGHSNMRITKRYIHPQDDTVRASMERAMSPHKSPHSGETAASQAMRTVEATLDASVV
jgi:integrase